MCETTLTVFVHMEIQFLLHILHLDMKGIILPVPLTPVDSVF